MHNTRLDSEEIAVLSLFNAIVESAKEIKNGNTVIHID